MDLREGTYENRLVAFIDILGFSALVKKSDNDELYADKLFKALDSIRFDVAYNEIQKITENSTLEMVQFSDSLVISLPYTSISSFNYFVMKLNGLQKYLADEGILIRGGVSAGKLYHKDAISYGPAFIRAYNIENELADYPRIVIDPQIMNFKLLPENEDLADSKYLMGFHNDKGNKSPIILEDLDGLYYINYLYGIYNEESIAKNLKKFVLEELDSLDPNSLPDFKVIRKLKWTLTYIESCPWQKNY